MIESTGDYFSIEHSMSRFVNAIDIHRMLIFRALGECRRYEGGQDGAVAELTAAFDIQVHALGLVADQELGWHWDRCTRLLAGVDGQLGH